MRIKFNYAFYAQMKIDNFVWVEGRECGAGKGRSMATQFVMRIFCFMLLSYCLRMSN